ncbi:MAG: hypothetical protein HXM94_01225 [Parvimonas micra]|uniref:Uncharacterized protein n=1 Tax=Parvimonas micra TaxID=33033 RepID=A0A930H5J9_9FIRM|nr:hypothetical protein [Parvimonas micra]MBF1306398.1 hypothetical protein [Parvimonas micra]
MIRTTEKNNQNSSLFNELSRRLSDELLKISKNKKGNFFVIFTRFDEFIIIESDQSKAEFCNTLPYVFEREILSINLFDIKKISDSLKQNDFSELSSEAVSDFFAAKLESKIKNNSENNKDNEDQSSRNLMVLFDHFNKDLKTYKTTKMYSSNQFADYIVYSTAHRQLCLLYKELMPLIVKDDLKNQDPGILSKIVRVYYQLELKKLIFKFNLVEKK